MFHPQIRRRSMCPTVEDAAVTVTVTGTWQRPKLEGVDGANV